MLLIFVFRRPFHAVTYNLPEEPICRLTTTKTFPSAPLCCRAVCASHPCRLCLARTADDIADEGGATDAERLQGLGDLRAELDRIGRGETPQTALVQRLQAEALQPVRACLCSRFTTCFLHSGRMCGRSVTRISASWSTIAAVPPIPWAASCSTFTANTTL
ncbi:transferase [Neisseria dentiae]|nr:transferase [Neisseria dentiae]